jgi:hypothetical protein
MPPVYHHPLETLRQAKARYKAQGRFRYTASQQRKASRNLELLRRADELRKQEKSRKERRRKRETQKALRLQHTAALPRSQLPLSNFFPQALTGGINASPSVRHPQPGQLPSSPAPLPDLPWYVESRQTPFIPSSPPLPSLQTMLARRHAPISTAVPVQDSLPVHQRASSPAHDLAPDSPNQESSIPLSLLSRSEHGLVRSPDHSAGVAHVPNSPDAYLPSTASAGGFEDKGPSPQSLESAYREHPERSFTGIGWPEHLR